MSNWILDPTTLPGFKRCRPTPMHRTTVQDIDSGKEGRIQKYLTQRWRYELDFEVLRSSASFLEAQRLWSLFSRHAGRRDTFRLKVPDDNAVTDHGFGVGDAATMAFQLQRTLGGKVQDVLGTWDTYSKPRTNLLLRSQEFGNAAWSKTAGGTGTAPAVTVDAGVAPDGSITADLVYFAQGSGTTLNDFSSLGQSVSGLTVGGTYVFSIWIRTPAGQGSCQLLCNVAGLGAVLYTITESWQRITSTIVATSSSLDPRLMLRGTATPGNSVANVLVWGAQFENVASATRYIPTTSAAVRVDPLYAPAFGDGFEPITEVDLATVSIFLDGDGLGRRQLAPWSRTNLLLQSQTLNVASWSPQNVTITGDAALAPDGTTTGEKVVETAISGQHLANQAFPLAKGFATLSVYAKAVERTRVELQLYTVADNSIARFNLSTGTVTMTATGGTASGVSATCTPVGNGWFRLTLTHNVGTASASFGAYLAINDDAGNSNYLGVAGSGLYFWGAQAEQAATVGDYIPTTSAAASRTDFTMGTGGGITFAVAPAVNAALSWSGSYFRRVRLNDDEPVFDWILPGIYGGSLELISVV